MPCSFSPSFHFCSPLPNFFHPPPPRSDAVFFPSSNTSPSGPLREVQHMPPRRYDWLPRAPFIVPPPLLISHSDGVVWFKLNDGNFPPVDASLCFVSFFSVHPMANKSGWVREQVAVSFPLCHEIGLQIFPPFSPSREHAFPLQKTFDFSKQVPAPAFPAS